GEDTWSTDEVPAILGRQPGWNALAVGVADAQQTPATLGCPPADSPVHLRRHLPETGSLDDAVPGGDNDGTDDRDGRAGTDPEDAALFPIASGPLDGRERSSDRGLVQLPDVDARIGLDVHQAEPGVICSTRWKWS